MEGFGINTDFYEEYNLEDIIVFERKSSNFYKIENVKKVRNNSIKVNHGKVMYIIPLRFCIKVQVLR